MVTWNIPDSRKELSRYYTGAEKYLTAVPGESPLDDTASQLRRIVEALSLTTPNAAHIPLTTERLRDIADELERHTEPATDRLLGMWEATVSSGTTRSPDRRTHSHHRSSCTSRRTGGSRVRSRSVCRIKAHLPRCTAHLRCTARCRARRRQPPCRKQWHDRPTRNSVPASDSAVPAGHSAREAVEARGSKTVHGGRDRRRR